MSRRRARASLHAPLYTRSFDLVVQLRAARELRTDAPLVAAAEHLCIQLAQALTFPARRARCLEQADGLVVEVRVRLRWATGAADSPFLLQIHDEIDTIGAMIGGWSKQLRSPPARPTNPPVPA